MNDAQCTIGTAVTLRGGVQPVGWITRVDHYGGSVYSVQVTYPDASWSDVSPTELDDGSTDDEAREAAERAARVTAARHVLGNVASCDSQAMRAGSFIHSLIDTMFRADATNLGKLANVFPYEAAAVITYRYAPRGTDGITALHNMISTNSGPVPVKL